MPKPLAVLIADVHYNIHTLKIADAAMRQAIAKANELNVPLIVAGDLHDTKANMRAECVNAMIETFKLCKISPFVMIGNHDKINEKSIEHSLNFLEAAQVQDSDYIKWDSGNPITMSPLIVEKPFVCREFTLIPYYHDPDELRAYLKTLPEGSRLIMHQGIERSYSGDYIQDKSAIRHADVKDFRVISGHYHRRQDIKTGRARRGAVGAFSYIGNPYTLTFGEANDPPKGFQILMDDGILEFVPTNLRKHVVYESSADLNLLPPWTCSIKEDDLVWVRVKDTKERLALLTKEKIACAVGLTKMPFRLDLIPTDTKTQAPDNSKSLSQGELLDSMIDSLSNTNEAQKNRLKKFWKEIV